jgi:hypothetical protein
MKRRSSKQDLLQRAQQTKAAIDAFHLKPTDLVKTPVAAGVLGKHEVTLRAWRVDGRGPPYIKDPDGASVLYLVAGLWDWCARNTVDPANVLNDENDDLEAAGAK